MYARIARCASAEEMRDTDVTSDAAPTSDSSAAESTSVDSDSSSDSSADITIHDPTVFANQDFKSYQTTILRSNMTIYVVLFVCVYI